MKIDEILCAIRYLAASQGFYGRLYDSLMGTRASDPDRWDEVVAELEGESFSGALDVAMFFEAGGGV